MSAVINFFIAFILGSTAMMNTGAQTTLLLDPEQPVYIVGESISLRCTTNMQPNYGDYSFFKDAVPLARNVTSNRWTISPLSITDAGHYSCAFYASGSTSQSFHINLRVFERPPAPTLSVEPRRNVFIVNQSVVMHCNLPRGQSATEVKLYRDERLLIEADNFGVLSLSNTEKRNSGSYTCQYKIVISGREVDSHTSTRTTIAVIDLPQTPVLRYAYNVQEQSGQVEIVCEIPNPSSPIHGYRLYRNGGEINSSRQVNQFVINYTLEFDGCYFCRSFVDMLGEEILSLKSTEVFLTLGERNGRSCQAQNSSTVYGLSRQGIKLYGSVLIGKLIVLISILLYYGIYILVTRLRKQKSETEELSFRRL